MKRRIVVADDTRYWREKISAVLARSGHEVITVEDGSAAITACTDPDRPVDLVVVDLIMPGVDGFEVAKTLRSRANKRKLHIIGVTDLVKPEDSPEAPHKQGFDAILEKSANLEQILFLFNKNLHKLHMERRPKPRIPTNIPAVCRSSGERSGNCVITNLSGSGAFLTTETPPEAGSAISLAFALPGGTSIRTSAMVFWVNEKSGPGRTSQGMGILFIGMNPEHQTQIDNFVKSELARS